MPWSFRQMLAPLSALLLFMSACGDDPEVRPVCGNGIVEAGETCDDGNRNNNDSCDNSCRRPTPDAGTEEDAGTEDDAGTGEVDAGTGEEDAGTGEDDAGTTEDAGTGEDDAGTTEDGGSGEQDAGSDEDGGSGEPDSGTDAGTGEDDAGTDAGTVQVSLDSFGPTGTFARTGTTGATFPEALTVRLREEAPAEVWVEVTSSSAVLNVQGGLVRIAPGERSATVQVTANLAADPETDKATLTATLGNDTRAATVRVLAANQAAELATLSPEVISVSAGQTQGYTVELDVPPAQDTVIQLALEPASLGTVPVTVTVPANSLSAKFDFTAGSTGGEGQLVAALNGQSIAAAVQVTAGSSTGHVVISEFAVAGPGGASDEFIELYNPTSSAVDISGWKVQYKAYSSTNYNNSFTLPANSVIQPRGYFLVVASGYASTSGNTVSGDANWGTALNLAANSNGGHVRVGYPELALTDGISSPLVVDTVGYLNANAAEGSPLPAYPPTAGSFERKASAVSTAASMVDGADALLGNGHDSNDNSADFILRPTRQPQNRASATEP